MANRSFSKHSIDELIDLDFSVSPNTTVVVRMSLGSKTLSGRVKFEWPEEVVSLLEVGSEGDNLVDKVFNADETVLSEGGFNDTVVSKRNSLTVDLTVASLVNKL